MKELEPIKTIDLEPQTSQTAVMLREYWSIALRRKSTILGAILLSVLAAWILCKVLPKSYRSETLIVAEVQAIPENYVQGVVESNIEQRIFIIQQQIMTRALLGKIIKEFNLYPDKASKYGFETAIGEVRKAIKVEMLVKGVRRSNFIGRSNSMNSMDLDAFAVSFSHEDPVTAMTVTARLASNFIEEDLRKREQLAEGTSEFFDNEVLHAKSALDKKEEEINRFKSEHEGHLPEQKDSNLRTLDRLQNNLHVIDSSIERLSDRLAMIEKGIAEYEMTGSTHLGLVGGPMASDSLIRRLNELRQKLLSLAAQYTESHPDYVIAKAEINQIEKKLVELYGPEAMKWTGKDFYLSELKKQQNDLKSQIAELKHREQSMALEKKTYEDRVQKAPMVERDLLTLLRDYDNVMNNYRALLDKRLSARVTENLEKRQKGAQFTIIEPANLPVAPDKPNQLRIMAFGLIFGCAIGFGLVTMQEQLNPRFRRPEDIEGALEPQLLAVVPDFALEYGRGNWQKVFPTFNPQTMELGQANGTPEVRSWRRLFGQNRNGIPLEMRLVAKWLPASLVSEQYRVAATRLVIARTGQVSTVAAVTSAIKGEGKTTTVVNLGYTLARDLGKRTLLVDCDFKCPALHRYAQTQSAYGLADLLIKDMPLETCLSSMEDIPCWILPVGNCETQSKELFRTKRLASVLMQLREQFEYILVNAPPILPLADMNILAMHADILLLVVRAGSTPSQFVKRALNTLRPTIPIHIILNGVGTQSLPYYMSDYVLNR